MNRTLIALVALSASAMADEMSSSRTSPIADSMSGKQQMSSKSQQPMMEPGLPNPSGRPQVVDGWNVFLTADVLYWRADEAGLAYALEANNVTLGNLLRGDAKVKQPNFNWDWGFRAGIGFNLPHDGWDLYFNYTYFFGDTRSSPDVQNHSPRVLYPVWLDTKQQGFGDFVTAIDAKWDMHLNVLDTELGREFKASKWLSLRPFAGVRAVWTHEKYRIEHRGGSWLPGNLIVANYIEDTVNMTDKSWGIGARGGLGTQWNFADEWSFYANFALSMLYSHFDVKQTEEREFGDLTIVDLEDEHRIGRAVTDVALGMRWDRMFCDNSYHASLQAGWEQHVFFDQNHFVRFQDDFDLGVFSEGPGNFSVQGFTFSARFDF